ncbi:MAG TPA: OadG family transporter subunit [bacterium]|nr:hypothetical protein [Myxococcales bacterium]OQA60213.1 MAG: oxaloacetate decarboxylase subunit gamma [bacterium ADurb.Bin270]HPW45758.1 OadG family transporter subunit [bacterium]HQC50235.1 OadG family transporter subunit [bacterium]HQG12812.1 OadG family transporter subunit [bacterium]
MIMDGVTITLIGMLIVFVILIFIIGAVNLSSWIIRRIEGPAPAASLPPSGVGGARNNSGVVAAISAAVARFRKGK